MRALKVVKAAWHELTRRPSSQVPALDALRAFAVLFVLGSHYDWPKSAAPVALARTPLFHYGWTGVDLFFVLSGFLIGKQLWRELDKTDTVRIPRFLLRRGLRIWPLYFATMAYFVLVGPGTFEWPDWVFLSNYLPTEYGRSWSLATEEQFYIAVPLLLLLVARCLPRKAQAWAIVAMILVVPVIRVFERRYVHSLALEPLALLKRMNLPIHLHCEALLIGLLLALMSTRHPRIFVPTGRWGTSPLAMGVTIVCMAAGVALNVYDKDVFVFFSLALIYGALVFFVLCDRSFLTRPLRSKFFYPFSRLAFGMYLNHFWIVPGSTAWTIRHLSGVLPPLLVFIAGFLIGTAISVCAAALTFMLIEHPFLQLRGYWLGENQAVRREGRAPDGMVVVEAMEPAVRS